MPTSTEKMSLVNLCGGAAVERFDDALQDVLQNIGDPNTEDGAREITLKVKIKPADNRSILHIEVSCAPKLKPAFSISTTAFMGKSVGGAEAYELLQDQQPLFDTNVVEMKLEVMKGTQK